MRTLTVALLRSAVGMMAMTLPLICQSGYAFSVMSTGCSGTTRLMYASLTSTSTSSESMSTMVQMPVRVKLPPADTGEIISPGCAALATTTPLNGARMERSFSSCFCTASAACATAMSLTVRDRRACRPCTVRRVRSASAWLVSRRAARSLARRASSRACSSCTSISRAPALAAASCDALRSYSARGMLPSRVASSWSLWTAIPSSMNTSITLPVTFDETVAARRATTYPEASSTLGLPPVLLGAGTSTVSTASAAAVAKGLNHQPRPATRTAAVTATAISGALERFAGALRSMRSWPSSSRLSSSAMVPVTFDG